MFIGPISVCPWLRRLPDSHSRHRDGGAGRNHRGPTRGRTPRLPNPPMSTPRTRGRSEDKRVGFLLERSYGQSSAMRLACQGGGCTRVYTRMVWPCTWTRTNYWDRCKTPFLLRFPNFGCKIATAPPLMLQINIVAFAIIRFEIWNSHYESDFCSGPYLLYGRSLSTM